MQAGTETGRQVVALGLALSLTAVAIDVLLSGRLTMLFDLTFVSTCLLVAVMVQRGDFFTVSLLPPLLMLAVVTLLALVAREAVADPRDSAVQAVVSGVAHHGIALFAGYAASLGWLGWRLRHRDDVEEAVAEELGVEPQSVGPERSVLEA